MAASDSASKLASLHDIPAPNSGVFASVESGELTAAEDDFAACWAWFRKRLLREPLGPEMLDVARRLYHAGLYEAAAVILLLFRGAHPDIRVRGGGTEDLEVVHLWAHLLWKIGRHDEALQALAQVIKGTPEGSHKYEDCWQLLVELGLEREMDHCASAKLSEDGELSKPRKGSGEGHGIEKPRDRPHKY